MHSISDLSLFVLVADTGNLSQAARELGLQPATASAALKRLEERLDTRLFERTTRSMRITTQGQLFLDYCRDALVLLEQGEAVLGHARDRVQGKLRLTAPADFGRNVLSPLVAEFMALHPGVTLILQCADRSADLFRDPVDLAFRYGRLDDASYVSKELARNRRVVVAAPSYLTARGTPAAPQDLQRHNCLVHSLSQSTSNTWRFMKGRTPVEVRVHGDRVADDGGLVREWAVAGHGIAYKSWLDARADVEAGRLVVLFGELTGEDWPLHAAYPHRSSIAPAARALLAFVAPRIAAMAQRV
ncbi:LysR family transcriptional regulator [Pseudoduganella sp. GCM10020061]|uniref:LysR family transcriptional regulator n=1 Tax=Pseudoduganella sp. GCM10020061 TaxID=3317345 RepID=UPI00362BE6BD